MGWFGLTMQFANFLGLNAGKFGMFLMGDG